MPGAVGQKVGRKESRNSHIKGGIKSFLSSIDNKLVLIWARFLKGRLTLIQDYNLFHFLYLPSYAVFKVICGFNITVSQSKLELTRF